MFCYLHTGMCKTARSRYGVIFCYSTQQRKILWRLFRNNNGKVIARTEVRYIAELQSLFLSNLHQKVASS